MGRGLAPLPATPGTVAYYLAEPAATLKPSTLGPRLSAIAQAHAAARQDSPNTHAQGRLTMSGIRRRHGTAPRQAEPATTDVLRRLVATLDGSPLGVRDRALLLFGFACASRRSELDALDVGDVEPVDEGLRVRLRRSKVDREGKGRVIGVPCGSRLETCPVRAWRAWVEASAVTDGPLFRPVQHGRVGDARRVRHRRRDRRSAGGDIMRQTGHKSLPVLRRYIRVVPAQRRRGGRTLSGRERPDQALALASDPRPARG